jgi:biopolymer transport protein TolR
MRHHKPHLDFELNLVPFIDMLSVCICFLLLTAVWINVGTMNVKQAVGGQSVAETVKKPMIWVTMGRQGELALDLRESPKIPSNLRKWNLKSQQGQLNLVELEKVLIQLKTLDPSLSTALIQPKENTEYEKLIELMDQFKKGGMKDLGVVPL